VTPIVSRTSALPTAEVVWRFRLQTINGEYGKVDEDGWLSSRLSLKAKLPGAPYGSHLFVHSSVLSLVAIEVLQISAL
jgi:hypothetical protein